MIIWGSYVIRKELKSGQFYCPHCETDRRFIHKLPRRWGHLYWIPLIVLDTHDSYVECQTCSKAYQEQVIDYDPRKERAQRLEDLAVMIGQVMVHVTYAADRPTPLPEIERSVRDLLELEHLSPEAKVQIRTPISQTRMLDMAREHGGNLAPRGQELVLRAALGSGPLGAQAQALVAEIGIAMGMTVTHVRGVLAEALAQPAAPPERQVPRPGSPSPHSRNVDVTVIQRR